MKGRLLYSLRSNARYQALVFGAAILGGIYFFISAGIQFLSLKSLVMALAYCWGLMLAIYLMGHGLVAIPRRLFRDASISGRLRSIQAAAPKVHENMEEAINKLEDLEAQVAELSRRKTGSARVFAEWIDDLAESSNLPESRPRTLSRRMSEPNVSVPTVITEGYLADLSRKLDRARHSRIRYVDEWDRLLQSATATQSILDSAGSKRLEIGQSSPQASFLERLTVFTPYTRYLYYTYATPYCRIFFGALLSLASICIIWSELIKDALPYLSVIGLTVVHHPNSTQGQIGFPGQVIASMWICYMCAAALLSLTEVKVWRGRALVRRNTAYESAFWYAMQVAKLTVPLSYNFMTFLPRGVYQVTTFYTFFGESIALTPLGKWFDYLFPIFILVPVSMTLFNLYGRVKRLFGFGVIDDEDEENVTGFGTGGWREGRDLIEREVSGGSSLAGLRNGDRDYPAHARPAFPPTPSERNVAAPSTRRPAAAPQGSARQPTTTVEPEDEGFFEAFGHRVRNTLDTMQTPKWMPQGVKKPKWLGGDGGSSRADDDGDNTFTRLFGGRGESGHLRL
ncbi:MAG: hypothetical protein M1818_004636 [Claussenomyces sp. TS43310]|nr:MAG: hypothetical protein M1818_004636 [Claussenomyces sp. TS43310]